MPKQNFKPSFVTVDVFRRNAPDNVLAMITAVNGPSYRPVGAVMRLFSDGSTIGTLSSGCIESDLAGHALDALETKRAKIVRYGTGSPYMDIRLPCGGGMDIILIPRPDEKVLGELVQMLDSRQAARLHVDLVSGKLQCSGANEQYKSKNLFFINYRPEIKFIVFGNGPEAATFSSLAEIMGYPNVLCSSEVETLDAGGATSNSKILLTKSHVPKAIQIDQWSAVLLFFHDHDWEPEILMNVLNSKAFYIGAQGSHRAKKMRELELEAAGANYLQIDRVRGPIGLIPSARDPRTLAVSVLAEVLMEGKNLE